jgi:biopolymer transport protein ExbD
MQLLNRKKRKVAINITSLIDVVLLLLIFFMLTTSFVEQPGIKLDLPKADSAEGVKSQELEVSISADGSIYLNGEITNLDELAKKIETLLVEIEEKSLVLKADKNALHGTVVKIMDIARQEGLQKIIIASERTD